MSCEHDLAERETACADGMCPMCLAARLAEAEKDAALDREIAQRNRDAVHELTARLAEAEILLDAWHCAYHGDRRMEAIDDDTTTWLAGISIGAVNVPGMTPDSATPRETASHE